jgi:rod shape-determining protein MreD
MIMRPGHQLLLPANPFFIWGSLAGALSVNMLLNMGVGRAAWMPDFLALVLVFWGIHQPQRIGIGSAFVFGIFFDVHQGALLGQHALSYTVLSFLAIAMHRRLLWFSVPSQAFQVLPIFFAAHVIEALCRMLSGASFPGIWLLLAPLLETLLWPPASVFFLLPQRKAPDPDANRPL